MARRGGPAASEAPSAKLKFKVKFKLSFKFQVKFKHAKYTVSKSQLGSSRRNRRRRSSRSRSSGASQKRVFCGASSDLDPRSSDGVCKQRTLPLLNSKFIRRIVFVMMEVTISVRTTARTC